MYLKRIELQGFKSFPEKTRLEFNKGITAVVGPNGSGKSNISDAVRWVLGEQSVKSLRGGKMEDIVFSGTETRRPLSFAEVSIVLDNADYILPIEFSEVTVTRAVFRSGESEYRINGSICRLKDVHALFVDTGIGKEGYSIIGQGKIDEILSERSEDRRFLFEEAAGIVKYRNRRNEAVSKLEKEKNNLLRINDIVTELDGYVDKLADKSDKAKKYLILKERQKLLRVNIFLVDAEKLENAVHELTGSIEVLQGQTETEKEQSIKYADESADTKAKRDETETKAKEVAAEISNLELTAERREGELNLKREQIKNIESVIERLAENIEDRKQKSAKLLDEKTEVEKLRSVLSDEFEDKNTALEAEISAFESMNTQMNENEQTIEEYNAKILSGMNAVSDIKGIIIKATSEYEQTELKKEQLIENIAETEAKYKEEQEKLEEAQDIFDSLERKIEKVTAEQKYLTQKHSEVNETYSEKTAELQKSTEALNDYSAKYKVLSELESDYSGYSKSVRAVLVHKDKTGELGGVIGAVGSLIEVKEKYEVAVETALGGNIQNIVTDTEDDAKAAINYLKQSNNGRVTFLPISAARPQELGENKAKLCKEPGIVGVAKELVRYDKKFDNIFSGLLGKTLVADNIENAIAFMKKYDYAFRTVTLDGELLTPGGAISGGSRTAASGGIVSRIREIKELKSLINKLTYDNKILGDGIEKLKHEMGILEEQLRINNALLHETAVSKSGCEQSLKQLREQAAALRMSCESFVQADGEIMEKLLAMRLGIKEHEANLTEAENNIESIKESLEQFTKELAAAREEKENKNKRLFDLRIAATELSQKINVISEKIDRISSEIEAFEAEISSSEREIERDRQKISALHEEITAAMQYASDSNIIEEKLRAELSELENLRVEYIALIEEYEQKERDMIGQLARLDNEMTKLVYRKEQSEAERSALYDEMWNEYELTHQGAIACERLDLGIAKLRAEERSIKGEIAALGEVDVGAIEEYKTVKERYDFLTSQRADILEAEEKLNAIIDELTRLMLEQFKERFSVISENFSYVFSEIFGGGKAQLNLTDERNILESGIEITAQPPGKRLVSMSLLSGGERALTAIALLFGILRMKPSPFCVLDEVDTALDDMNVMRFANYIKRLEHETQFILVTHRKGTMEVCDTLYGVTMQERGVSKLISVRLEEQEQRSMANA